jgi:hypothetical protein
MEEHRPMARSQFWQRAANALAGFALLGWILYAGTGQNVFGQRPWPEAVVDYRILYEMSEQVVERGDYPVYPFFPYPPSAVVLFYATTWLPFEVAAAAWLALCVLATLVAIAASMTLVHHEPPHRLWLLALLAFGVVNHYIVWDLRSLNCNMIYCALVALALVCARKRWDVLAGLLLATSVALKLYPVLVVGYFLWIGRLRTFLITCGFLVFFFAVLPALVFGPVEALGAYQSWLTQLRAAASTLNQSEHPILIALPFTLTKKLGADSDAMPILLAMAWVLWLGAVAACLLAGRVQRRSPAGWDMAVDGGLLVLTPVAISPYLEAYHVVPALLLALALLQVAGNAERSWRARTIALACLGLGWMTLAIFAKFDLRGVGVFVQLWLMVTGLTCVRLWNGVHHPSPISVRLETATGAPARV